MKETLVGMLFAALFATTGARAEEAKSAIVEIRTDADYKKIYDEKKPMLIVFSWTKCGPCKGYAPTVEEIAKEFQNTVAVGRVYVDYSPDLVRQFGVTTFPSTFLYRLDRSTVFGTEGVLAKEHLRTEINKTLEK